MATHRPTLRCLLALACCACSAESASPTRPDLLPSAVQPRPAAAKIILSSSSFPGASGEPLTSLTMLRGSSRTVEALAVEGGGAFLGRPDRVVWATSDAAVVMIRPTGGWGAEIMAAAPGVARLVANLDGLSAEASITVIEGQEGGGTLVVESFSIVEEGSSGSGWYYAPRIRFKETSGLGSGLVREARITIPGVVVVTCTGQAEFGPGESRDLLGAIYGMYPFEIGSSRAAQGPPSAVISLVAGGSLKEITVKGSYAPMEWPSYELSGTTPGPMSCGAEWPWG
jgi:hypothetical protein